MLKTSSMQGCYPKVLLLAFVSNILFLPIFSQARAESSTPEWLTITGQSDCAFLNIPPPSFEQTAWDGACKDGFLHGQGTLTYVNGNQPTLYRGNYTRGEMNGDGEYTFWLLRKGKLKKLTYRGSFVRSRMHGYGVLHLDDMGVFKGEFKKGFVDGPGVLEFPGVATVSGYFQGGPQRFDIVGVGEQEVHGDHPYHYKGTFRKLVKEGQGVLSLPSGAKYEGTFHDDQYQGFGKFTLADGDSCEGDWVSGRIKGVGRGVKQGRNTRCVMDENGNFLFEPIQ